MFWGVTFHCWVIDQSFERTSANSYPAT